MFEAGRTGLASFLFSILRPRDARAALVDAETVRVMYGKLPAIVPLGNLEKIEVNDGLVWSRLRLSYSSGRARIFGMSRKSAAALAEAVETARREWWQRALASLVETLKPVHDRIAALADPPKYVTVAEIRDLEFEAQNAASQITGRWPKGLADAPEIHMLRKTLAFLEAPEEARKKANDIYIANELIRSRKLLDTIESRPLTEEQRKAVVIDEQHNLVIAAAGSGKTSVIVAKAGWLIQRMRRKPSELLLLAFARDARNEMKERIHARLGDATAHRITVSTFHAVGMAIIGKAEGKRPSLSPMAKNEKGLFELLKNIVADLFNDSKLSKTLRD